MKWLLSFTAAFFFALSALAQVPPAAPQQKIDELVRLLQDPEVKAWLDSRKQESGAAAPPHQRAIRPWPTGRRARARRCMRF